ncbi:hypothetical protein GEMRC1_014033 [Eukaryota sp. GEM-RC1]
MTNLERELSRATDILNMPHSKSSKSSSKSSLRDSQDLSSSTLSHQLEKALSKVAILEDNCSSLKMSLDDVTNERDELKKNLTHHERSFTEKISHLQTQMSKLMSATKKAESDFSRQLERKDDVINRLETELQSLRERREAQPPGVSSEVKTLKNFIDHRLDEFYNQIFNLLSKDTTLNTSNQVESMTEIHHPSFSEDLGQVIPSVELYQKHARLTSPRSSSRKKKRPALKNSEKKVVSRAKKLVKNK